MKFKKSQLNRPLLVSSNHFNYKQISNAFYGVLVAGLVVSCSVQKLPEKSIADYEQLFKTDPYFSDTFKYVIRGVILDKGTKQPITKCFVKLEYFGPGVWTDTLGRFKLSIPTYFLKDTLSVSITGGNYQNEYISDIYILKKELPNSKIIIIEPLEDFYIGSYITY